MDRPELDFMNHGSLLQIQGENFTLTEELIQKIIENLKRNCWLSYCKNCSKAFIVNSATHEICWRCKSKKGNEEL